MKQFYRFGPKGLDGHAGMSAELGGKGAHLAEMSRLGLPVPPGFTIPTSATGWSRTRVEDAVTAGAAWLKADLVSVRSGAPVSMPGMMDTVLNVGVVRDNLAAFEKTLGVRTARDCYRRFLQMYGDVVVGLPSASFEKVLDGARDAQGVSTDAELSEESLLQLCEAFEQVYGDAGHEVPTDPAQALQRCVQAVFASWEGARAREYRRQNGISDEMGTAVNVQQMVFGNRDAKSATGVCFSRNPSTGEPGVVGEWLPQAQGEDVVAGIRTPLGLDELKKAHPKAHKTLLAYMAQLEQHYRDMQDVEFTIESGHLWVLQTRSGKRTGLAAARIAVEMRTEGLIQEPWSILRPEHLRAFAVPQVVDAPEATLSGLAGCPGAVVGVVALTSEAAIKARAAGQTPILVRHETSPEDIGGMGASAGVVTATGGFTSHAAVVARAMNLPCVVGCQDLKLAENGGVVGELVFTPGMPIALDGTTGRVWIGQPALAVQLGGGQDDPFVRVLVESAAVNSPVPVVDQKDAEGRVHLYYGDLVDRGRVEEVLALLKLNTAEKAVVHLTLPQRTPDEVAFLEQLGWDAAAAQAQYLKNVWALLPHLPKGTRVCLSGSSAIWSGTLDKLGLECVAEAETLADLLDRPVRVSAEFEARVFGDPATRERVLGALKAAGHTPRVMTTPILSETALWSLVGGK